MNNARNPQVASTKTRKSTRPGTNARFALWLIHHCKINQIFRNTRCNTPKRATSWRGPSPRYCALATQLRSKKCLNGGELGNTASYLTDPRFEAQASRSRDERVTARPTGRSLRIILVEIIDKVCQTDPVKLGFIVGF